jgi:protein-disulfide isomerase
MIGVALVLLVNGRVFPAEAPRKSVTLPVEPVPLDGLATKGSRQSPVGLIMYSDFECPFCRRFAVDVLPVVQRDLIETGLLLVAFKHLPLESIHRRALASATLAECANRRGEFWKVHDRLFSAAALSTAMIDALTLEVGFNQESSCLAGDGIAIVREHQKSAEAMGISGTPAFLLGPLQTDGRVLVKRALRGFQSAAAIAAAVKAMKPATQ